MSISNSARSGDVVTEVPDGIIIENLTEMTLPGRWESVGSHSREMQLGDGATVYNHIYDPYDKVVGDTVAMVIATRINESDGHLITEYTEAINLLGGTLISHGTLDRVTMWTGEVIRFDVVGTSGRFLGMKGIREWRLLPPYPPLDDNRVSVKITLSK